jgi:hypothetical protein
MMYWFISLKQFQALKCETAMNDMYAYTTSYSLTSNTKSQIKLSYITHYAQVRNNTISSSYISIWRTPSWFSTLYQHVFFNMLFVYVRDSQTQGHDPNLGHKPSDGS